MILAFRIDVLCRRSGQKPCCDVNIERNAAVAVAIVHLLREHCPAHALQREIQNSLAEALSSYYYVLSGRPPSRSDARQND